MADSVMVENPEVGDNDRQDVDAMSAPPSTLRSVIQASFGSPLSEVDAGSYTEMEHTPEQAQTASHDSKEVKKKLLEVLNMKSSEG